jgi:hypothetical protein
MTPRESQSLGSAPPASSLPISTNQAIAGTAMLLGLLLVVFAARQKLSTRNRAKFSASASSRTIAEASPEDAEMLRDIRELTDRLAAELDTKADRLERLIKAADQRIQGLESLPKETRLVEPKPEPRRASAYDATHRDVYDLADQGLSVLEIAQKLDRPTGQVELILNLRKGTVAL